MGLVEEIGPADQSCTVQLPHHWARSPPEIVIFPIPVSKLVKDLGVQAGHEFSPSVQCTGAANKARQLLFMTRRSFQDLSKSAFIPLYGICRLVRHLSTIQGLATRLVSGIRHLPYKEKLQPSFLAAGLLLLRHSAKGP